MTVPYLTTDIEKSEKFQRESDSCNSKGQDSLFRCKKCEYIRIKGH